MLNLKFNEDPLKNYDAIGVEAPRKEQRMLIKGRVVFESSKSKPRIGQLNSDKDWERVVLVLFDDEYQAVKIYEATPDDIEQALEMNSDSHRKKRGPMSIAKFKIISQRVWTIESGLESEIWDNNQSS